MKKYMLIFGGGLGNKGAQAMSFIAISELAGRFPEYEPVLVSPSDCKPDIIDRMRGRKERSDAADFAFRIEWGNTGAVKNHYLKSRNQGVEGTPVLGARRTGLGIQARAVVQELVRMRGIRLQKELYGNAAFAVDISGFTLGDLWGLETSMGYLQEIEMARMFDVPLYLLPQSFGPFDYGSEEKTALFETYASEVLRYPRSIFAREQPGFDALRDVCPEARLRRSDDLVLQSKGIELERIFKEAHNLPHRPGIDTPRNVGIVPNMRNAQHGDPKTLNMLYREAVSNLLQDGYDVYLIRHASEDLEICQSVKEGFSGDDRVHVLGEDRYCFEYEDLFCKCDFLIASRFHSIVHAYRCSTPCISVGWAVKYKELLSLFDQERYVFNVTEGDLSTDGFIAALDDMKRSCKTYRASIRNIVENIQGGNVFDCVEDDFRQIARRA